MTEEVSYTEEIRYCWQCPKCKEMNESYDDPKDHHNENAVDMCYCGYEVVLIPD